MNVFLQVTPVMWEINQQWICSVPKQFVCPPPIQLEPLAVAFNISSDFHSLGDGIYSKAQMEDYKKLRTTNYKLCKTNYALQTVHYKLCKTNYKLEVCC
jgi:hypothetical protein